MLTIHKINNFSYKNKTHQNKKEPNFTATLKEIEELTMEADLSGLLKRSEVITLQGLTTLLGKLEEKMAGLTNLFDYWLGKRNILPKVIADIEIGETNLEKLDYEMHSEDNNIGNEIKEFLTRIGAKNPDKITLRPRTNNYNDIFENRLN